MRVVLRPNQWLLLLTGWLLAVLPLHARVEITSRQSPTFEGWIFGKTGVASCLVD
ncbi:hypothetical protein ACFPMF_22345 [Larkinella bovis]|uniref:Uncharacterized protein n=1 Tax=Larkinella bovis TaxID=683041 RepID=A0ABW0IHW7_9BACT